MNTKLIVALVVIGVLALTVAGFVAAQAASASGPNGATRSAQSGGFFGWMGRCLGFRGAPDYATGSIDNQTQPITVTAPTNPNTSTTTTYQRYFGGCGMMRGYP